MSKPGDKGHGCESDYWREEARDQLLENSITSYVNELYAHYNHNPRTYDDIEHDGLSNEDINDIVKQSRIESGELAVTDFSPVPNSINHSKKIPHDDDPCWTRIRGKLIRKGTFCESCADIGHVTAKGHCSSHSDDPPMTCATKLVAV